MIPWGGFRVSLDKTASEVAYGGTRHPLLRFKSIKVLKEAVMGRGLLLWLLGVPIPVIILLWLFFGH
jgi:hypothetical protein